MEPLSFEIRHAGCLAEIADDLARLRITVFREWPYLYDGADPLYERQYLEVYLRSPQAAAIVARDGGGRIVGASTCLPLADEAGPMRAPFEARGQDLRRFFYFGESVLLPAWRGQGAGVRFFAMREEVARAAGADFAVFCAVRRPPDHPARPEGWAPLDAFWARRGYAPLPGLTCVYPWQEVGTGHEVPHRLDFWGKALGAAALPERIVEDR
ncbi:GNAT family N-acetyltransferase [Gluconacetobacter sp. 1c LMG 22058]|uniref:GNAT family N-acetyltransferase n=1 Tax=Gluconacetobacter dulcium TaxID=2729096 RepID=A0A7W4JX17_9PROT|nr:GNAT family N-acetyltransferase [Gluconacetobacter dulcium]MBB2196303.1 GNAT family N-acetyltransferase [Gluconacetobacter dulcium]